MCRCWKPFQSAPVCEDGGNASAGRLAFHSRKFQSAPVCEDGGNGMTLADPGHVWLFQSAPVCEDGGNIRPAPMSTRPPMFQSAPVCEDGGNRTSPKFQRRQRLRARFREPPIRHGELCGPPARYFIVTPELPKTSDVRETSRDCVNAPGSRYHFHTNSGPSMSTGRFVP